MLFEKIEKGSKDIVFVYTTCASIAEARSIALSAIENKLAVSADYWLVNSIYPWKNVIQEIDQYMILFATEGEMSDKLIKHVESEHSYSVPMIAKSDISITNQSYRFWLESTLSSKDKYITQEEEQKTKKKGEEFHLEKLK